MKKLLFIFSFLLCAFVSSAQFPNNQSVSNAQTIYHIKGAVKGDEATMITIKDTLNNPATIYPGSVTIRPQDTINHAIFPIYQSNGIYWSKISSSIFISGLGIDSITLYNGEICQWQGGTRTCWFLTPSTGGSVDSFHLSPDSLAIYQYRNGTFIDSIYLLHTTLYFDRHFGQTYNYGGNPYAQLLSATRLVDSISVTADSVYMITHYADGDVDSTTWIGDGSGGGGGSGITALTGDVTASGTGSVVATLATVNGNVGSFTNANITVNGKGLITAAANGTTPVTTFLGLSDVLATSLQNNDVFIYKTATSKFENEPSLRFSLAALANGDILEYNSTSGLWENVQPAAQATAWAIVGNAATVAGTNFVGTTDDVNLMFKRNGVISGLIDSSSQFRTYFGYKTGNYATSTGIGNSGFGYFALRSNTTGYENFAGGYNALQANTTGYENVAVGKDALKTNTTGFVNVAVGFSAAFGNTTGGAITAFGPWAAYTNTTANYNTAIGNAALYFNATGENNTAVGHNTLHGNANVSRNTAIGFEALFVNTGNDNTALGYHAGYGVTSGSENFAGGYNSMSGNNNTGSNNIAIGGSTLLSNTTGSFNSAIGHSSLFNNTTGNTNLAIGYQAGQYSFRTIDAQGRPTDPMQKSDTSIYIGFQSGAQLDSQHRQIVIAAFAGKGLGSNSAVVGDSLQVAAQIMGSLKVATNNLSLPDASAQLDVSSTTKGFLPPRMTTTQMNAISSPATGLKLYNTDAGATYDYNGSAYKSSGTVSGSFSGVGTATTVFTVTFGGTQPNATYKVNVVPTALLSAAAFYVTNKTTTTFDVTYLAGLTGTVTFDWSIFQ